MKMFADYQLLEFLGESNHGLYWRARPPARLGVDEDVAIKILIRDCSDRQFDCVAQEIRLLGRLRTPWVIRPIDAGHVKGRLYYAVPFSAGGTLAQPSWPLTPVARARAVSDAARGVDALHRHGVIHRDLRPSKILLTERGGQLTDLGLAAWDAAGAGDLAPTGSVGFMAPEALRGDVGPGCDIFGLGATLHAALTGTTVYPDVPRHDLLAAFRHVATARPTLDPALPTLYRDLVSESLARDPSARPGSASTFAQRLDALIARAEADSAA